MFETNKMIDREEDLESALSEAQPRLTLSLKVNKRNSPCDSAARVAHVPVLND